MIDLRQAKCGTLRQPNGSIRFHRTTDAALMLSKAYDALLAAGAPEDKARAVAEEITVYEIRFAKIDTDPALARGRP
jgi:hypothetical protein